MTPVYKYQWQIEEENRKSEYKDYLRWKQIVAAKKGWTLSDSRLNSGLIQTERANQETMLAGRKIQMHVVKVPYRLGSVLDGWDKNAIHYQVKIWINGDEKKAYVFQYSQGSGIKQFPTIREILFSFVQDAGFGCESFEDFCSNVGGDIDSRKAFRSYESMIDVFAWFTSNHVYRGVLNQMIDALQEADSAGTLWMEPPVIDGSIEMPKYGDYARDEETLF